MKIKFAAAAAIAALCVSGGAVAGEAPQTVKLSVSADGLDLTKTADVRKLRNRIADAAAVACDPADRMIVNTLPDYQCRRDAIAGAEPIVQELSQAARRGAMAR